MRAQTLLRWRLATSTIFTASELMARSAASALRWRRTACRDDDDERYSTPAYYR